MGFSQDNKGSILFYSSDLYKNSKLPRDQIGRRGVRVEKDNEKFPVVCASFPQNLELGQFHVVIFQMTANRGLDFLRLGVSFLTFRG